MGVLKDYLSMMSKKSPITILRSFYWNTIPSNYNSIKNLSSLLNEHNAKFTFFITGNLAKSHKDFINNLKDNGNEIASHGFLHNSYTKMPLDKAREDLMKSINEFRDIGINVEGFRAHNLDFTKKQFPILKGTGIKYTSSGVAYNFQGHYTNAEKYTPGIHKIAGDIIELPISAPDDWNPIVLNGIIDNDKLFDMWKKYLTPGNVFLLHPIRMGHKKYIGVLERLLKASKYDFITLSEMAAGKKGIALTGDIGIINRIELLKLIRS
jgi:peptidoglycan/xylan/chitin deacetylase (PgdA/CDA1 family)